MMSSMIQNFIVGGIFVAVVLYVIYKIVKMVQAKDEPVSPCCGCDKPCKSRKINRCEDKK